jgi:hypothetical protein
MDATTKEKVPPEQYVSIKELNRTNEEEARRAARERYAIDTGAYPEEDRAQLFDALGKNPTRDTGKLKNAFDALSEPDKIAVERETVKNALREIVNKSQALTDRLGEEGARRFLANVRPSLFTEGASPTEAISGVAHIANEVFGPTIQEETVTLASIEKSFSVSQGVEGVGSRAQGFFLSPVDGSVAPTFDVETLRASLTYGSDPGTTLLASGGKNLVASSAGNVAARTIAGGGGGLAAGEMAGAALATPVAAGIGAAGGASAVAGVGAVAAASGPGAPVVLAGAALASSVAPVVREIQKFAQNVSGSGAVGGYVQDVLRSGRNPSPQAKKKDNVLVLTIVAIVCIVVFLPMMATQFEFTNRDSALATSLTGGPGGPRIAGAPEGPRVEWTYAGTPPPGTISVCPLPGSAITQRPYGTFSHVGVKAFDLASREGSPVRAAHDGYVVSFRDTLDPYTFENNSYGNNVLLVAKNGNGATFFTMYGHLETIDPKVAAALKGTRNQSDPKLIKAGEVIGTEDATGSTYGTDQNNTGVHLHFEYRGPGELTLPAGCP